MTLFADRRWPIAAAESITTMWIHTGVIRRARCNCWLNMEWDKLIRQQQQWNHVLGPWTKQKHKCKLRPPLAHTVQLEPAGCQAGTSFQAGMLHSHVD